MELIGSEATGPLEAAKQAYIQAWGIFWHKQDMFHQNLKTQPGADPVLPRIERSQREKSREVREVASNRENQREISSGDTCVTLGKRQIN